MHLMFSSFLGICDAWSTSTPLITIRSGSELPQKMLSRNSDCPYREKNPRERRWIMAYFGHIRTEHEFLCCNNYGFGSLFWLNELKVIWRSSGSCFSLHSRRFRRSNGRPEFSMGQREEECVECQIVSKYFLHSFVSLTRSAARCCNWACANHRCCPCDQCSIWAQLMIRLDGVHGPWPSQWRKWFWNNRICRVGPGTFISPE